MTLERGIGERGIAERVVRRGNGSAEVERRDADNRLPWLETPEDDAGESSGRFLRVLLVFLVLAALAGGGAWYYYNHLSVAQPDGSLIRAESGPYKVRPEQPGGKTFAGTGDSAYAVSEGEFREAALAQSEDDAPAKGGSSTQGAAIQLGAYMDEESAQVGWSTLVQRNPVLSGMNHRIVPGRADLGTVYRLQAVAASPAAAKQLCRTLKDAGTDCYVKD